MDDKIERIAQVARDADLFIVDAQYTQNEIVHKRGWGHGTFASGLSLARRSKARQICFTHHDPGRTDDALDFIGSKLREQLRPNDPPIELAREGLEITL